MPGSALAKLQAAAETFVVLLKKQAIAVNAVRTTLLPMRGAEVQSPRRYDARQTRYPSPLWQGYRI
jgi:hypothetical protein